MTTLEAVRAVTGGVDTHLDVHVAAALDPLGALLGSKAFETTPAGYQSLLEWLLKLRRYHQGRRRGHGFVWGWPGPILAQSRRLGDRGQSSPTGLNVVAMESPTRSTPSRRLEQHKVVVLPASRRPRTVPVEAIRVLVVAKRSARQARVKALVQMRHLVITAPDQLRCRLKGLTVAALVSEASRLRPRAQVIRSPRHTRRPCLRWLIGSKVSKTRLRARPADRSLVDGHRTRADGPLRRWSRHRCCVVGQCR